MKRRRRRRRARRTAVSRTAVRRRARPRLDRRGRGACQRPVPGRALVVRLVRPVGMRRGLGERVVGEPLRVPLDVPRRSVPSRRSARGPRGALVLVVVSEIPGEPVMPDTEARPRELRAANRRRRRAHRLLGAPAIGALLRDHLRRSLRNGVRDVRHQTAGPGQRAGVGAGSIDAPPAPPDRTCSPPRLRFRPGDAAPSPSTICLSASLRSRSRFSRSRSLRPAACLFPAPDPALAASRRSSAFFAKHGRGAGDARVAREHGRRRL